MKKILVYLSLVVILFRSISCSELFAQTKSDTIERYYETINKAELSVVRDDYKSATQNYSTAFKDYGGIRFAKDLMNAYYAALFAGDTSLSIYYLDSLAFYGFHKDKPLRYFERNKILVNNLTNRYDSIQSLGKIYLDWAMIKACDSFFKVDQAIRKQSRKDGNETGINEFRRLDSLNFYGFLDYIDKQGFPSFHKIGFSSMNSASPIQTNVFYLLLWHQRSTVFPESVEHKIQNLIYQGHLLPYDYAMCRFPKYDHYGFIPTAALSVSEIDLINSNRREIYMETVDEFKEKMGKAFKIEGISATSQIPFVFHNMFTAPSYEAR